MHDSALWEKKHVFLEDSCLYLLRSFFREASQAGCKSLFNSYPLTGYFVLDKPAKPVLLAEARGTIHRYRVGYELT